MDKEHDCGSLLQGKECPLRARKVMTSADIYCWALAKLRVLGLMPVPYISTALNHQASAWRFETCVTLKFF
ncbi:uncharacterized [Tachysurus ichikawai]